MKGKHMPEEIHTPEYVPSESDERITNNTYRHQYRVLTDAEKAAMVAIKDKAAELDDVINQTAPSRERSLALTKLEEAVMWAVKGITK
jgi:hypothetical protein